MAWNYPAYEMFLTLLILIIWRFPAPFATLQWKVLVHAARNTAHWPCIKTLGDHSIVLCVLVRSTEPGCLIQITFLVSLESSRGEGCIGMVPWCLDLRCKSFWTLNNFFTENEIKIVAENFGGIGMLPLKCCWKSCCRAWYNGIYLLRFGFRMWDIYIDFEVIFCCWIFK